MQEQYNLIFSKIRNHYVYLYREPENDKPNSVCNKEEEVDSGVDGEAEIVSPPADENIKYADLDKNDDNEKNDEPEEDANYELIESVVFKGKMIKRQISIQSHSKSVADLFAGIGSTDDNLSITGSRKVRRRLWCAIAQHLTMKTYFIEVSFSPNCFSTSVMLRKIIFIYCSVNSI